MATWTIYSKNQCPFCDKAKYELRNEDFEVKNISENQEFLPELMDRNPNARTMPQIFKGDQLIGGYDALMALRQVTSGDLSL
jgi:glutaredoxin 3|tara:strand:- start:1188 stop:1433 length:246 start_codon:yes stop_codon:yes gene_type:complete